MAQSKTTNILLSLLIIVILGGILYFAWPKAANTPNTNTPSQQNNLTFTYPQALDTNYIEAIDWPPQAQILDQTFNCTAGGAENERAGQTQPILINGRTYCVTKITEGAAGSIYTQYAYAFAKNDRTVILTFSLRFSQCANYDQTQMQACENERQNFNINNIVDQIAQSAKFDK